MDMIENVKKIAVLRATMLGDFIFALPALAAIHESYPQAEITYLGRAMHTRFLPGRVPGVSRVIAVPPSTGERVPQGWVMNPEAQEPFLAQMRAEGFDLAFQMQGGGGKSNPFVKAFGARVTAGCRAPGAGALDRNYPYAYYQPEVVRLLAVAALAGARLPSTRLEPRLSLLPSDLDEALPLLGGVKRPFAVVHPGSTDPRRRWSVEKFAQVGDYLARECDVSVVLTGSQEEAERVEQVQAAMRQAPVNLCGKLSLGGLAGALSQAELLVANDTGPLHLGLAVGAKAVGLFWSEYLINSLPLERVRFRPVISWERTCPQCGIVVDKPELDSVHDDGCGHWVSFVESITTEEVMHEASSLLEG